MTHQWDEFSKSLAVPVPRRESLRRLGAVLAGAVLSPLGTAWAAPKGKALMGKDPCRSFCKCRNTAQQNACLAACRACNNDTSRLCGSCGSYVCCREPGPGEYGGCIDGACRYACYSGTEYGDAVYCDGICTFLGYDPDNCGACGHVCYGVEDCVGGVCQACVPDCGPGSTHGAGWCGDDGCGGRCGCLGPEEYCPTLSNWCAVSGFD
jgi:hypothetical protein